MRPRCSHHSSIASHCDHEAKSYSTETTIGLLRLIRDKSSVRRPIGIRAVVLVANAVRQWLRVRPVSVANIYLGMPQTTRCERETASVGAERRARIVRAAPNGYTPSRSAVERCRREEIGTRLFAVRVDADRAIRRKHRRAVPSAAHRVDSARRRPKDRTRRSGSSHASRLPNTRGVFLWMPARRHDACIIADGRRNAPSLSMT